jgi:hypothetical protein
MRSRDFYYQPQRLHMSQESRVLFALLFLPPNIDFDRAVDWQRCSEFISRKFKETCFKAGLVLNGLALFEDEYSALLRHSDVFSATKLTAFMSALRPSTPCCSALLPDGSEALLEDAGIWKGAGLCSYRVSDRSFIPEAFGKLVFGFLFLVFSLSFKFPLLLLNFFLICVSIISETQMFVFLSSQNA